MNIKVAYAIIGILLVLVITMGVYIAIGAPIFGLVCFKNNSNPWGERDVVPDEETAMKIAEAIVVGHPRFHPEFDYRSVIILNERYNTWEIYFSPYYIADKTVIIADGMVIIQIKRDSGMVVSNYHILTPDAERLRIMHPQ